MVRTKADGGCAASRKVVAARAPRKSLGSSSAGCSSNNSASPKSGKGKYAGGNPACARPIPDWQKGIGSFLVQSEKDKENISDSQGSSSSSSTTGDEIEVLDSGAGASGSCD